MKRLKTFFKTYKWHIVVLRVGTILPLYAIALFGQWAQDAADYLYDTLPDAKKDTNNEYI